MSGDNVNQPEALRLAVSILRTKVWTLEDRDASVYLVQRLREAANILQRMEAMYDPGSEAWVAK